MDDLSEPVGWGVYLVRCCDNTLYTGITNAVHRRLDQHNGIRVGGAKYTAARRPVTLVYWEPCENRSVASKREYAIRKLPRSKKDALIQTQINTR